MEAAVIEAEAMKLSECERALLVERLQQSLSKRDVSFMDEHLSEAKDRYKAYLTGEMEAVDGEKALAEIEKNF